MLSRLSIQNYVIIDQLEIDFSGKLNAITGETGAGKSIIAGALGLILGERADTAALVNKEKKCVIEGAFGTEQRMVIIQFLKENELDFEGELVLRREIGVNGKSRAFINDTPVNLSHLQELGSLLVDLHQQFDTLELTKSDFQLEVMDALAGHALLLEAYQLLFRQWQQLKNETAELTAQKQQFDKEADYNRFQFKELEDAGFKENELEETDAELKLLNNSEGIKAALSKVYLELKENETPVIQQLKVMLHQLSAYASLHPGLPDILQRIRSAQIELQDIAAEVDHISNQVNYDPQRIEYLNDRLSAGYKLQKKHGVNSTNELLGIQRQLEQKLQSVLNMDEAILQKETESKRFFAEASGLATKISDNRHKQIKPFEDKVNRLLVKVGMPNAKLKVEVQPVELNQSGADAVEFLFDANLPATADSRRPKPMASDEATAGKGNQFQPVRKVASGGELSRLMLCIKSLVAQSIQLPTLIFDEIDSGISGEAARQVGIILKDLAEERQVICITHQPQIAGKANAHFFVYKEIINNSVQTSIRLLTTEERITTIAKMLSGEKPTAAALENAREMVMN